MFHSAIVERREPSILEGGECGWWGDGWVVDGWVVEENWVVDGWVEECGECGKGWDEGCGAFKEMRSRKEGRKEWRGRGEGKSGVGGGRFFPCWGAVLLLCGWCSGDGFRPFVLRCMSYMMNCKVGNTRW